MAVNLARRFLCSGSVPSPTVRVLTSARWMARLRPGSRAPSATPAATPAPEQTPVQEQVQEPAAGPRNRNKERRKAEWKELKELRRQENKAWMATIPKVVVSGGKVELVGGVQDERELDDEDDDEDDDEEDQDDSDEQPLEIPDEDLIDVEDADYTPGEQQGDAAKQRLTHNQRRQNKGDPSKINIRVPPAPFTPEQVADAERKHAEAIAKHEKFTATKADNTFKGFGIASAALRRRLEEIGFKQPNYVQVAALEAMTGNLDTILRAPTGTGKSLTFTLALAQNLALLDRPKINRKVEGLVLTPTKELAEQLERWLKTFLPAGRESLVQVVVNDNTTHLAQEDKLSFDTPAVLIGTASRVRAIADKFPHLLDDLKMLVIDEADRVLDLATRYVTEKEKLVREKNPKQSILLLNQLIKKDEAKKFQTIMTSATINTVVKRESKRRGWVGNNVAVVDVGLPSAIPVAIAHSFIPVTNNRMRLVTLARLLENLKPTSTLVFLSERVGVLEEEAIEILHDLGLPVTSLAKFKKLSSQRDAFGAFPGPGVFMATEDSARGIDTLGVDLVVLLGPVSDIQAYLHAAGRTGRPKPPTAVVEPGNKGTVVDAKVPEPPRCITLYTEPEFQKVRSMADPLELDVYSPVTFYDAHAEFLKEHDGLAERTVKVSTDKHSSSSSSKATNGQHFQRKQQLKARKVAEKIIKRSSNDDDDYSVDNDEDEDKSKNDFAADETRGRFRRDSRIHEGGRPKHDWGDRPRKQWDKSSSPRSADGKAASNRGDQFSKREGRSWSDSKPRSYNSDGRRKWNDKNKDK